jgi:hypothetical protein
MKSVTPERINRAIAWYRQHQGDIEAALPLQTQGRLFKAGWPDALERSIVLWEAGSAPVNLATIYIYRPIVLIAQVLRARSAL